MVLFDFQSPYSKAESYAYDSFIAPAVTDFASRVFPEFRAQLRAGAKVLDVGCGGGQNAEKLLTEFEDFTLTGVDLSAEQIERAGERLARFSGRVALKTANVLALDFPAEEFDIVYSIASLKHWSDQQKGLAECVRVLKKGGTLIIAEANKDATWQDCASFTDRWLIPFFFKPAATVFFKYVVAGNSLTQEDGARLLNKLPLEKKEVRLIPGLPGFFLTGQKT